MPKKDDTTLLSKLKNLPIANRRKEPLWKGPEEDGITFSLLSRFLVCRERFRLLVVEGLTSSEGFNHRLEYGSMWHACEEGYAQDPKSDLWLGKLMKYYSELREKFQGPVDRAEITKWMRVCREQFPIYVNYWKKHPQVKNRKPLYQEESFKIPVELPSGRVVSLRGKFDSVDLINGRIWLQENKSKGTIVESEIIRQLGFDLQTMIYLSALERGRPVLKDIGEFTKIAGVRYNVIRRPLSGGKGSIIRHKATKNKPEESWDSYYQRLADIIKESPQDFFCRYEVALNESDISVFETQCLFPILEQLCDWWQWIKYCNESGVNRFDTNYPRGDSSGSLHWRHPFGVYNVLNEGGSSELDGYLENGSMVGLTRTDNLFPELT